MDSACINGGFASDIFRRFYWIFGVGLAMELMTNKMTMTSFEVSELLGSRHDSVKRAIERLVEKGSISQPPMVDGVKKPMES